MLLFLYTKALMLLHAAYFRAAPATAVKPPLSRCVFIRYSQIQNCLPNYAPIRFGGYLALYTKAPYRRPSTVQRKSAFLPSLTVARSSEVPVPVIRAIVDRERLLGVFRKCVRLRSELSSKFCLSVTYRLCADLSPLVLSRSYHAAT